MRDQQYPATRNDRALGTSIAAERIHLPPMQLDRVQEIEVHALIGHETGVVVASGVVAAIRVVNNVELRCRRSSSISSYPLYSATAANPKNTIAPIRVRTRTGM